MDSSLTHIQNFPWAQFFPPIWLSLKVAAVASFIVFGLGLWIAWLMAKKRFRGKSALETVFMLPLVLPPAVTGFILLVLLGRSSWIGQSITWLLGHSLIFTWWAAAISSIVVAFPLVYQTIKVGFTSVSPDLQDAARSMGASEWQVLTFITLPLSFRSLVSAFILGFARGLGEFGATLMIAGNIPKVTQTVPTAIYAAVDSGNLTLAWFWSGAIVLISFVMLLLANKKTKFD
jgi:molybdate transport system permease protein